MAQCSHWQGDKDPEARSTIAEDSPSSRFSAVRANRLCEYLWRELGKESGGVDPPLREADRVGGRGGKQENSAGVGRGVQARGGGVCKEHVVGGGPPAQGGRGNLTHHASSLHASHRPYSLTSHNCLFTRSLGLINHTYPLAYSPSTTPQGPTITHCLLHTFAVPHTQPSLMCDNWKWSAT